MENIYKTILFYFNIVFVDYCGLLKIINFHIFRILFANNLLFTFNLVFGSKTSKIKNVLCANKTRTLLL